MDLKTFLLARIEEDEAVARAAIEPKEMHPYGDVRIPAMAVSEWPDAVRGYLGGPWGEHAANTNPTRVLAECAAKRAIVEMHRRDPDVQRMIYGDIYPCTECGDADDSPMEWPCPTMRILAAVYADHPDYQPEWAA